MSKMRTLSVLLLANNKMNYLGLLFDIKSTSVIDLVSARRSSGWVLHCQLRGSRFKPWSEQKFGSRFMLHAHPYSASETTSRWISRWILESVPNLELT